MKNRLFQFLTTAMVIGTLSLSFHSCSDDDEKDIKDGQTTCINTTAEYYRTITQGTNTREYVLHIPTSYNSSNPAALVINFHGFGGCAMDYSMNAGDLGLLNTVADNENFIVVYPQAAFREKGDNYWEPGDDGSQDIMQNDAYFTQELIAAVSSEYSVDPARIYATGYSNGGMMAYSLACSRPDLVAAVGIMSGTMLDETCDDNEYTSVIIFHGIADDVLPYEGNQDYQSIADLVGFWLDHNGIPSASQVITPLNGGDVVRDVYDGGNENTSAVLYTINREFDKPGGHVWFSGDIEGDSPSQIMWHFLAQYSL